VQAKDAIIVGGGIIGCSIALRLADSGIKTAIIERGKIGCEASRAAAGMLSPQASAYGPGPFFDLCMQSLRLYRGLVERLQELSGIDPEYQDAGTICVALSRQEQADIDKWSGWQINSGLPVNRLSATDLRTMEPSVSEEAVGGVKIAGDHQVENRLLMDAMDLAIRRAGIEVIEGRSVDSVLIGDGGAAGIVSAGQTFASGSVILAAGCWSGSLARDAGIDLPVIPARGQMLAVKADRRPFAHVIHSGHCYLVPRRDNRIVIGSTVEYAGFRKATTVGGLDSLLQAAVRMVPAMKGLEVVETWSGLRPDTPDHLPVLGPCEIDNLYLATGHFRNGVLLAPITAEVILKCVVERSTPQEITTFSPGRFSRQDTTARSLIRSGQPDQ
jgi:glycine oxidase